MASLDSCGLISALYAPVLPGDYVSLGAEFEAAAVVDPLGFEGFAVNLDIVAHQHPMADRPDVVVELIDKARRRGAIDAAMAHRLLTFFDLMEAAGA
jgi:hypothetical protein